MEESALEFFLPEFSRMKCVNGDVRKVVHKTSLNEMLFIKLYPNGNEPENEEYVSITFDNLFQFFLFQGILVTTKSLFHITVSVVDINGELRFPQTFAWDIEIEEQFISVKIERFIKRSILLDSSEELLPEDTLTLRCEGICFRNYNQKDQDKKVKDVLHDRKLLYHRADKESWFLKRREYGCLLLDLKNPDSPLCTRLRQKSEFFEALFRWPKDGFMRVKMSDYDAFLDVLCYVRFENLRHIETNQQCFQLYQMATKFRVVELQKECSAYLIQNMTTDSAVDTLKIADLYNNSELRRVSFKFILSNWYNGKIKEEVFDKLDIDLKYKVLCAAQVLKLENADSEDVQLNRKIVLNSPTWSIFEKEQPDLAQVISSLDSGGYTLDDPKNNLLLENIQEQPVCYDSYR